MNTPFLSRILIRDLRCIARAELHLDPGFNFITGDNAQGKTSALEAVAILLRLQSPRTRRLGDALRHGARGLLLDGHFASHHLQFYYSPERKKLALDSVEQSSADSYLEIARAVWFANTDTDLIRGPAETRRRFLDTLATQTEPGYRSALRAYEKALRSRNRLLKTGAPWRQIEAFDSPLSNEGSRIMAARQQLLERLAAPCSQAHARIAPSSQIQFRYLPSAQLDLNSALAASREEDRRWHQTTTGPHRDDIALEIDGQPAAQFASEGQQRSLALAAKLGQAALIRESSGIPPVLVIDDIFGELDPQRRNALFDALPSDCQKIITSTSLVWLTHRPHGTYYEAKEGTFAQVGA